jgi:acyl-CoA thioester hydrolase
MHDDTPYSGRFQGPEHRFAIRVYFEDTDAGGVVYHAGYLRFMERARSDVMRLCGIDQQAVLAAGEGVYVVHDLHIKYRASAKLDDNLLVVSRFGAIGAATMVIHQRVMRADQLVAEADVSVAFVGPDGRPRRQPRGWVETFKTIKGND